MSVHHYIESLTLADAAHPLPSLEDLLAGDLKSTRSAPPSPEAPLSAPGPIPGNLQAAVDVGSLLSFIAGVDPEDKDDILYSVQLAQRGASGAYDRFTQTPSWYQKYIEILENLGWAAEQLAFARYDQSQGEFRMDKAALAIIAAVATQNQLTVLQESMKALGSLTEDDNTIRLFDFQTSAQLSGNFQIGAAQKAENGALSMALGAFHFRTTDARRRFLFFTWGAQQVEFWTAAQKMTLNSSYYAGHRDTVKRKLGAAAGEFIAGLTLG